jgi:DNA replication protein DnaC
MPSSRTTNPPRNPDLPSDLVQDLRRIGLRGLADALDDFLDHARARNLETEDLLREIVRIETLDRARRSLERRQNRSKLGAFKPMADFDWSWPTSIDRDLAERALDLRFLREGANFILVGAHGLGKTMILENVAHRALLAGHTVLFLPAAKLLSDLSSQDSSRTLERRFKHYASAGLLAIDELGYLSYDTRAADLLFEVVSRRYAAKKPIALSTNLAFADWSTVFPNATCTVALIDRLTHKADILSIKGKSWRTKEAAERNALRHPTEPASSDSGGS